MTDREALVNAIADHPREDTPRLALGDWLEENGQPERAEFVRVSCEAARTRAGTERRAELLDRADDLLAIHEAEWLGEWAGRLIDWDFSRGFLRRVRMTARTFLEHGEELFWLEPASRVELVDEDGKPLPPGAVATVVSDAAFARVRDCAVVLPWFDLQRTDRLGPWLRGLAGATHATRLRRFGLAGRPPHDEGLNEFDLTAFTQASHLGGLRHLDLSGYRVRSHEAVLLARVAGARFAPSLRVLNLRGCHLPPSAFARLATDEALGGLRSLDVSGNTTDASAWDELFASRTLGRVRAVAISAAQLTAYARSPMAQRVRDLTVHASGNDVFDGGRDSGPWRELVDRVPPPRCLTLRCCNPGREGFAAMRRTGWLRKVRDLSIAGDSQYEVFAGRTAGIRALLVGNAMPRLTRLRLHEACDARVLAALSKWRGVERLESLDLNDDYYGRLEPSEYDPVHAPERLRELRGVVCRTDEDIERFLTLPRLERLESLQIALVAQFDSQTHSSEEAVSVGAAVRLIRSERLLNLVRLDLGFADVPAVQQAVRATLADPAVLPRLRHVRASGDTNPPDGLQARFGLRCE